VYSCCILSVVPPFMPHTPISRLSLSLTHTHTALRTLILLAACPVSDATRHATHTIQECHTPSHTHPHSAGGTVFASGVSRESCHPSCHPSCHTHTNKSCLFHTHTHTHSARGTGFAGVVSLRHAPRHATHSNKSCLSLSHTHTHRRGHRVCWRRIL